MIQGDTILQSREVLDVALRLVTSEGLGALTIKRLAVELGCSVGTVYNVFTSKDALVAELQREAIDVLYDSFVISQSRLDDLAPRGGLSPRARALARVVGAARFLSSADEEFPCQMELSRLVFADPSFRLGDREADRVAPAALRMLEHFHRLLEGASDTGALSQGVNLRRAVIIVAGTTGIQLASVFSGLDPDQYPPAKLAAVMVTALLRGWGARPKDLAAAEDLVDVLAARGHLVPNAGHPVTSR